MTDCSCILPAYNEAPRIKQVLDVLVQSQTLKQIVVVNDGSTDDTLRVVNHNFPQLKIISLPYNQGKTAAVRAGLKKINTSHVLTCDADLSNVRLKEIDQGINLILHQPQIDMIIFRRLYEVNSIMAALKADFANIKFNEKKINQFIKSSILNKISCLLSGERVIKTSLLQAVLKTPVEGYVLEIAINQYCLDHDLRVCWLPASALNNAKIKELGGISKFLHKYISMHLNVMSFVGVKNYLRQIDTFCNDKCQIY